MGIDNTGRSVTIRSKIPEGDRGMEVHALPTSEHPRKD